MFKKFSHWGIMMLCLVAHHFTVSAQCPPVTIDNLPLFMCGNEAPIQLVGTPAGGTFIGPGMVGDIFDPMLAGEGNHNITYEIVVGPDLCTNDASVIVEVITDSIPVMNLGQMVYCIDDPSVQLTGNLGTGFFIINGAISSDDVFDPSAEGSGEHEIVYMYFEVATGCNLTDTTFFTVLETPFIPDFGSEICIDDDPIPLLSLPDNGGFSGPGVVNDTLFPALAGTGMHVVSFTDSLSACPSIPINIEIINPITVDFDIVGGGCTGQLDTIVYSGDPTFDGTSFNWIANGADIVTVIGDTMVIVNKDDAGLYELILEVIGGPCSSGSRTEIIQKTGVSVSTIDDVVLSNVEPVTLSTTATSDSGSDISFVWSPPSGLDCDTCQNPIATVPETTTYVVTATDENACFSIDSVTITLVIDKNVYIPNAFTPNNDGVNDEFLILGNGIDRVHFMIFDRWGEQVFESNDINMGWNGFFNSRKMNSGVYVYYAEVEFFDGDIEILKGNVTILR